MRMFKSNHVIVAGNIANVTIRNGTHGQFGSITIAVDDGYFKQGQNGQDGEWIDRTHFVECKVNANFLKKLKVTPDKGDMICLQGKLTLEKWKDTQSGQERSALKVAASDVDGYVPKAGVIAMKAACSNQSNQSNQQNGGYQQNQQPQNGGGHNQQRQNNGGQNQQPQNGGGYNQNGGGHNNNNSGGGYQQPQDQH